MKVNNHTLLALLLILACGAVSPAVCQAEQRGQQIRSDQKFTQENGRAPSPGDNLPVDSNSESKQLTPESTGSQSFWSGDTTTVLAVGAVIIGLVVGMFFFSQKKGGKQSK